MLTVNHDDIDNHKMDFEIMTLHESIHDTDITDNKTGITYII